MTPEEMTLEEKAALLAEYEIKWWQAHHRGDINLLIKEMSQLYSLLYKIPYIKAEEIVKYRVEATKLHDTAEEFEDVKLQKEADKYWKQAKEELQKHFNMLLRNSELFKEVNV